MDKTDIIIRLEIIKRYMKAVSVIPIMKENTNFRTAVKEILVLIDDLQ